jgi:hypothetical protein
MSDYGFGDDESEDSGYDFADNASGADDDDDIPF